VLKNWSDRLRELRLWALNDVTSSQIDVSSVSTTAEGGNTLVNVGEVMTQFANSAIQGISDSIVALIPVITLTTVIGIAIRMFKKYVKA